MALGITIDLYLMDGTASGRCQAKLSNWNAIVYRIPHSEIKNSEDLEYINSPGVYLLFGKDDETQRKFIYIGEADDVQKRLLQPHTFEKDDSYWTEAVIFVTSDGTLNKGHVKYLENRLYTIAKSAQRYIIKNGNAESVTLKLCHNIFKIVRKFIVKCIKGIGNIQTQHDVTFLHSYLDLFDLIGSCHEKKGGYYCCNNS